MYTVIETIIAKQREQEEQLIIDALKQLLNREPTTEDLKKTERVFMAGEFNKYTFKVDGIAIGTVRYDFGLLPNEEGKYKMGITFEPNEIYK